MRPPSACSNLFGADRSRSILRIKTLHELINFSVPRPPRLTPLFPHVEEPQNLKWAAARNSQVVLLCNPKFSVANVLTLDATARRQKRKISWNLGVAGCCDILHWFTPNDSLSRRGPR